MTTLSQLDRIESLLLAQINLSNYWSSKLAADLTSLQARINELVDASNADKAAAEAQAAKIDNAIGLLQALTATIADLRAQLADGAAITQPQIDALTEQVTSALGTLGQSAVTDAASDAALDGAVAANTPADPPAEPPAAG